MKDFRHESDKSKFEFPSSYSGNVMRGAGLEGGETGGMENQEAAAVVIQIEVRSAWPTVAVA